MAAASQEDRSAPLWTRIALVAGVVLLILGILKLLA
jgi:hypothetical protein